MRWIVVFLLGLIFIPATGGASASPGHAFVKNISSDTGSRVDVRSFSSREIRQYKHSGDFQYERESGEALTWWDRLKLWFWQKITELISAGTGTGAGRIILILLVIGLVIYVIVKMADVDKGGLLGKRNEDLSLPYMTEADIHSVDFDQQIQAAVEQNNYRLAVRLWYLKTLKRLSDKEIIFWKPGKTNHEYISDMKSSGYANAFRRLTGDFEHCWYGEKTVEITEYETLKNNFADFNQQLS